MKTNYAVTVSTQIVKALHKLCESSGWPEPLVDILTRAKTVQSLLKEERDRHRKHHKDRVHRWKCGLPHLPKCVCGGDIKFSLYVGKPSYACRICKVRYRIKDLKQLTETDNPRIVQLSPTDTE